MLFDLLAARALVELCAYLDRDKGLFAAGDVEAARHGKGQYVCFQSLEVVPLHVVPRLHLDANLEPYQFSEQLWFVRLPRDAISVVLIGLFCVLRLWRDPRSRDKEVLVIVPIGNSNNTIHVTPSISVCVIETII